MSNHLASWYMKDAYRAAIFLFEKLEEEPDLGPLQMVSLFRAHCQRRGIMSTGNMPADTARALENICKHAQAPIPPTQELYA